MRRGEAPLARYFDACAPFWRRNYAPEGAMRERIDRFVLALSGRVGPGARLLDFGCGTGEIARALHEQGHAVTGCDISPAMIAAARAVDVRRGLEFVELDAAAVGNVPFADAAFDAVISSSVFEYLADPPAQAAELRRVLRPGGWLLITVPDPRHPVRVEEAAERARLFGAWWWPAFELMPLALRSRTRAEYLHRSRNRYSLDRWREILEHAGLDPAEAGACEGPLALLCARA